MKKERWKEPAYLSFPIVYLFHGKLIFTSPFPGSSLDSTARPVWLLPRLPSPSLGFMTWLWGGLLKFSTHKSFQWYNAAFVLTTFVAFLLSLPPLTLSFFSFHLWFTILLNVCRNGLRTFSCPYLFVCRTEGGLVASWWVYYQTEMTSCRTNAKKPTPADIYGLSWGEPHWNRLEFHCGGWAVRCGSDLPEFW